MPVTKTAKRAQRISKRKKVFNKIIISRLETAVRLAQRAKSKEKIIEAISIADKAAAKKAIHRNKAARIKSALSKLFPKTKSSRKKSSRKN